MGIWPPRRRSNPAHSLHFPSLPLSYWVVRGSLYSFPEARDSCLVSASVLQGLLHLKMYSWCICGERYSTSTYSSAIFSKRLFSSFSLSAIKVVSSSYLRLLIYQDCLKSWFQLCFIQPEFLMMCSAYKLNKQGDNIQPWWTAFPIWKWEGNRQEGQGNPNGGNSLQVSDIFISLKRQEKTN